MSSLRSFLLLLLITSIYVFLIPGPEVFAAKNLSTVITFDSESVPSLLVEVELRVCIYIFELVATVNKLLHRKV